VPPRRSGPTQTGTGPRRPRIPKAARSFLEPPPGADPGLPAYRAGAAAVRGGAIKTIKIV